MRFPKLGLPFAATAGLAAHGPAWALGRQAGAAHEEAGAAHEEEAGGLQLLLVDFCIGSGPGSRNLGPPAAVASCVTQPMGLGKTDEEGCRI